MEDDMTDTIDLHDRSRSYASGTSTQPLIGSTIGDLFDRVAASVPDNDALISCHQNLRFTYAELQEEVNRFARGLMALGIEKGDRVGIWSPNNAEWVITQFATPKVGCILVNVNPAYRTSELEYALKQSGVSTLIIARRFKSSDYVTMLNEVCPEVSHSQPGAIRSSHLPDLRSVIVLGEERAPGTYAWADVLGLASRVSPDDLATRQRQQSFDDPINIQYTSGTTGFPKGATLSHHSILNNGYFIGERMRFTDQDRLCIPVPFYHCFGMVLANLACVTHGATMVLPSDGFDAESVLRTVEAERCTALHGVPTMFIAELGHPRFTEFDLSTLRTGIMAGSPCPIEVMKQVIDRMHMDEVTICYGMTETSPVSTQTEADDSIEKRVGTVGRVHPHVEVKVVDPTTGEVVPRNTPGELCSRGYIVMLGYWNNPEATAEAIDAGRWMHTGDLATMDEDGYLNIVGRIKDMIIRGGENVYPREIEEFLYTHPAIQDVQVIGVPDERYGEEVMACVVLKPGMQTTAEEIREFCRGRIAHFKVPRYVQFTDGFPMTVTGKIQKYKMREAAIEELGLNRVAETSTA
jgi:fatty-acyl-CoA synthase